MKWKGVLIGVLVLALVAAGFFFVFPALNQKCHRWYHHVDFLADRRVRHLYGDLRSIERELGEGRALEIRQETWAYATEKVGAKPFYCN